MLPPLWVMIMLLCALAVWLVSELKEIVVLLVIAFAVAYLIEPLINRLERMKISRPVGIITVASTACLLIMVLFFSVLPVLQREYFQLVDNLPEYVQQAQVKIKPLIEKILPFIESSTADQSINEKLLPMLENITPRIWEALRSTLLSGYSITLAVLNIALLPFMIFYISVNFPAYRPFFLNFFAVGFRPKVQKILHEIDYFVSGFVRGQLIVSFILFLLYLIGLYLVGVELWFLLAFIAGFGNLVPYLGTVVGVTLASIMSLITFGDWTHLFYVWIVFAVVQFLEGTFITPKVLGDNVGLSPLAVILAIVIGGTLFGLLGVFLAVPGAAIFKVIWRHFHAWILTKVAVPGS